MKKETDSIKQNGAAERTLDAADRRILGALVEDATISYAELGEKVALSAPAVHERVKRLKRSGAIRQTAALLDPKAISKSLLAFVHIDTKGWGKRRICCEFPPTRKWKRSIPSPETRPCC